MTTPTTVRPAPAGGTVAPLGSQKKSRTYYDDAGKLHTAAKPVPVDGSGVVIGREFRCKRCGIDDEWFNLPKDKAPTCGRCDRRMEPVEVKDAPRLPWTDMLRAVERPVRPVWALGATAAFGAAFAGGDVHALVFAVGAPVVGALARRITASWRARRDLGDVAPAARRVGYTAAVAAGWLAVPASVGVDSPAAAAVTWGSLAAAWAWPAGAFWKRDRDARNAPPQVVDVEVEEVAAPQEDPGEKYVRLVWAARMAAKQGQQVVDPDTDQPVVAERAGRLVGTWLEDWHRVTGGWAATIVGHPGVFNSEAFMASKTAIASAYRMKASMVTVLPDPDDENRADILVQRTSPIVDSPGWAGPDSIDVVKGVAPIAVFADGGDADWEFCRPGWGCPHVGIFGTTGSAKSELINAMLTIGRWAHYTDVAGVKHGIIADFLIDPQQGQSFAPFLDDLAAPVATSLDEAMLLIRALTAEALRRNRYLAREAKTWDERRKKWRTGRKWWNPIVDGPILALTIDEAHDYLSNKEFANLVTKAGRMWRKCGLQVRIATHTPLLTDLGGSMALRDMLTGGFVWVGRTANSLTGPTAFNGRLPADPRLIPPLPGMAYILTGPQPKAMLARTVYEKDWYDWVRDVDDNPIGYPAVLPAETLAAFGAEYVQWVDTVRAGGEWVPGEVARERIVVAERAEQTAVCRDAVFSVLAQASGPLGMDDLDGALVAAGTPFSTRTVRGALKELRDGGLVVSVKNRHRLTDQAREESTAADEEQLALVAEGGEW